MDDQLTVREARAKYYSKNGIPSDGGDSEKISKAKFGPITLFVPNFDARRAALKRHDIHHLIVGVDTSLAGEAIVGGWEVGSGCWPFWVSSFLEPQAMSWGLILAPRKTFKWFIKGRRSKNLYKVGFDESLLSSTVADLRQKFLPIENSEINISDIVLFSLWSFLGLFLLLVSISFLLLPIILIALLV